MLAWNPHAAKLVGTSANLQLLYRQTSAQASRSHSNAVSIGYLGFPDLAEGVKMRGLMYGVLALAAVARDLQVCIQPHVSACLRPVSVRLRATNMH